MSRLIDQRRPLVAGLDRRAWPAGRLAQVVRPARSHPRVARVLLLAIIVAATIALAVAGSGLLRNEPAIKALESTFVRPFEYTIPVDGGLRVSSKPNRSIVAWTGGPADWPHASDELSEEAVQPQPGEARGVVVGLGEPAMSHAGSRIILATGPVAFLTELRDLTGVQMGAIVETTFDGRPAAAAQLPGFGGTDIHPGGLSRPYVGVTWPGRLTVTEVEGTTIFIFVWARTQQELDAWLPVADGFVGSIHFVPN